MRSSRTTRTLVAGTTAALVGTLAATAAPAQAAPGERSLATVLAADGNRFDGAWNDFDVLDRAVRTVLGAKPDSDVAVLADGGTALTAFLPTDRAFRKLVHEITGERPATERATFQAVASLGVDTVETVLLYHVVPGPAVTYRQAKRADGVVLQTAADAPVTVQVANGRVSLQDLDASDPDPRIRLGQTDVNAGNRQLGHGINRVLRPLDLP
ncbi:fasciclin domain-containing protein [Nocardioides sp. HDW12B]|uniref:fasciclin domain-containing protein n=1 Tax=Nocardioides sp. HDW12B TaxID=2714939 RepID=UPI001409FE67|nr:fasciclin domain-containing protein [Nocardioides sp. HDW12B]QIK67816.1 fasciclin domain-containing protein [Nocardioides sp. HDW12B]